MEKSNEKKGNKFVAPDLAPMQEAIKQIEEEIVAIQAEERALTSSVAERETGKDEFMRRKQEMHSKLDEYQKIIDGYDEEKQKIWKEIDADKANKKASKDKLSSEKDKLPYKSLEQIDQEIRRVEQVMYSGSHSLKQEKIYMSKISALNAAKPQLIKFQAMQQAQVPEKENQNDDLRTRLNWLNAQIKDARDAKRAQLEQFKKLNEQRQAVRADMSEIFEKRNELRESIKRKIQEKRAMNDEMRTKERAARAAQAEARAAKYEKQRADRLQRDADNMRRKLDDQDTTEEEQPYATETARLNQILSFCKELVADKAAVKTETVSKDVEYNNPEGSMVLVGKKQRAEENVFFSAKGGKKMRQRGTKKDEGATKIKHTVESLQVFSEFKVTAPLYTNEIAPIVEKLEAQLEEFNQKIKVWESEREERRAAAQKALEESRQRVAELQAKADAAKESAKEISKPVDTAVAS